MEAQEVAAAIKQAVEANKAELVELSHTVHEMPELSFEEHKTSALVEDFLERHGFSVERGTYDMSTCIHGDLRLRPIQRHDLRRI
jgi:metal-dependent amidase/aminoacylase/carboxypeptidase family protein